MRDFSHKFPNVLVRLKPVHVLARVPGTTVFLVRIHSTEYQDRLSIGEEQRVVKEVAVSVGIQHTAADPLWSANESFQLRYSFSWEFFQIIEDPGTHSGRLSLDARIWTLLASDFTRCTLSPSGKFVSLVHFWLSLGEKVSSVSVFSDGELVLSL